MANKVQDFKELISQPYPRKIANKLDESVVFNFSKGIPAFEDAKRFVLHVSDKIKPFLYLKSLDLQGLGFICIDPFLVKKDYCIDIPAKDQAELGLEDPGMAFVLSLVTVEKNPRETTANLLAPIIINMDNLEGRQVILSDDRLSVRYNIWKGLEKFSGQNT
ncbi:MAG: flagellar assembly protein FliW [Victivallales bacterium]|nr:flagellar assembly protein FliW [Victivallales bacterium]